MLRWVVIMFLLPTAYIVIVASDHNGYVQYADGLGKMMFLMSRESKAFQAIALVWFVILLINLVLFIYMSISAYCICRYNFDDGESLAQTEFERIKDALGIKGKVSLVRNDSSRIKSPFATGVFNRRVVVPFVDEEYDKEELEIILYHELTHFKKHDLVFKALTILIVALQCYNPFAYLLLHQVEYWSECDCDDRALSRLEQKGIDLKQYCSTIYRLSQEDEHRRYIYTFSMLFEKKHLLERRFDYMKDNRKNFRTSSKAAMTLLVAVFILASTVTSYAAGLKLAESNDKEFKVTQEVEVTVDNTEIDADLEEFVVTAEESKDVEIVCVGEDVMTLGGASFYWTVPVGTRYVTSAIYLSKGTVISIACTSKPSNCTYWYGLMRAADNSSTVVETSGTSGHDFTISSSGYYYVMVENRSSEEITVGGSYNY